MTIWIDAQLSPSLALWINENFDGLTAQSVRSLGLRDATDKEIFIRAKEAKAVIMSKDDDFARLLEDFGPPPSIIWITSGNSSNGRMRLLLSQYLLLAINLISKGESLIEIGSKD
jgi:predicted nuclease of predicted toxin-antitoxin system